ncbi:MAG: serine/threonine-protein kinase [Planctomycetota bacterium]
MKPFKKIGQYEIIDTLYARPDYACYLACGPDDKNYVIKAFDLGLLENASAELKAARQLQEISHPNLVRIIEVKRDTKLKIYYYVMECWGDDLRNTLKEVKADPKWILDIIKQVLAALSELHQHNMVHRDIKPENIFLKGNQVKIGDYGLVKSQRYVTQLTTIAGTRDYMAPEVLGGKPYDYRCDIYSTGVVLKELLGDETHGEVCSKAMAEKPTDRFQTVEEFINALTHRKDAKTTNSFTVIDGKIVRGLRCPIRPKENSLGQLSTPVVKSPIFQKLDIQRYPPKPELRGQDDPGVLVKTLQTRLDEILRSTPRNNRDSVAASQNDKYQSALPVAEEWTKAVEQRFTRQNSRTADAYDKLAGIYLLLGNHQKSEENYRISSEIDRRLYGEPSRQAVSDYYHLAQMFAHAGNYSKAKECYGFSLRMAIKNTSDYTIIANNIAVVYCYLTEYQLGLNLLKEALVTNEKQNRFSEPVVINLYNMALTYEAMGNKGTAEPLYKQAKDTLAKLPPDKITLSEQDKQRISHG